MSVLLQANQSLDENLSGTSTEDKEHLFEGYSTGRQLEQSYLQGCHCCTILWHNTVRAVTSTLPAASQNDRNMGRVQARNVLDFQLSFGLKAPWEGISKACLRLRVGWTKPTENTHGGDNFRLPLSTWPRPFPRVTHTNPIPPFEEDIATCQLISTSPEMLLGPASRWIHECVSSHEQCRWKTPNSSWLPTRLLDIGCLDTNYVRVVTTAETKITEPYLTLSYCWGGKSDVRLENDNFDKFSRGIPIVTLPKTIFDAITVAKRLDFRWLWVDSLCIIQDNAQDWSCEAATMGDIYSNSFLTIAALGASTATEGLFGQRDPLLYTSCKLFQSTKGAVYLHQRLPWETFSSIFENAPLHLRGWVSQERLLSPRTLNFGAFMVWECRETYRDEYNLSNRKQNMTLKGRLPLPPTGNGKLTAKGGLETNSLDQIDPEEKPDFYPFWCELLTFYTKAALTRETDRPIAISGAIRTIERRTGWKTTAGLWEQFLHQDLLWFVRTPQDNRLSGAPTWSWLTTAEAVSSACRFSHESRIASVERVVSYPQPAATVPPSPNEQKLPTIYLRCSLLKILDLPSIETPPSEMIARFFPDIAEYDVRDIVFAPIVEGFGRTYGLALRQSKLVHGAYERVGILYYATQAKQTRQPADTDRVVRSLMENAEKVTIQLV